MKNHFTVSDDGLTAIIHLKRRNGEVLHCFVDTADLPKLQELNIRWYALWNKGIQRFYVRGNKKVDGKWRKLYLHSCIMEPPPGLEVDHKYHDPLDNRRENMSVVTTSMNQMNRSGANRNSKTGHRGISHHCCGKFTLQISINRKRKYMGLFATIEQALAVRNQYPGYGG